MRQLRRIPAVVFAGDARVWRAACLFAAPLLALSAFYLLRPRDYYTGTDNVEAYTYVAQAPAGAATCVTGLYIPADTGRLRLSVISRTRMRPQLKLTLRFGGAGGATIRRELPAVAVPANRISAAVFTIPRTPAKPSERPASLCLTAADVVNWGGTPLPVPPASSPATLGGQPIAGRIAVWYLPRAGEQRSYASRAVEIVERAALFRPSPVGPWLYWLALIALLPALAVAAVRCMALASAGQAPRRVALWLFAIAALNFACWALFTPPFQSPDEVDHFAYTQSLVQRGEAPSQDPGSPLPRWSSSESLALEDTSFFTDHQAGGSRPPWSSRQQHEYDRHVAALHPGAANGGGNETAATHGPLYYAALAPAYALASSSPFSQLTLMRLASALIGALTVLFTYLLARELAPGRPWLAVLAALLVAYQPMYGFISGSVNNDVGVNAGAAALELLMIVGLRRGLSLGLGVLMGALLIALPIVKGTAYALYPVVAIALAATLWRHHRRRDLIGLAGFAATALGARLLTTHLGGVFRHSSGTSAATVETGSVSGSTSDALAHPLGYLGYLWQVFLPRLPFMSPHWQTTHYPGFVIFVERGWGAFGWYDVLFPHWLFVVIFAAMIATVALGAIALVREWAYVRRNGFELIVLALIPLAVVAGVEAAFYTSSSRPAVAEFGRYVFPAIAPLAVLVVAGLHAFGRRLMLYAGVALLVAMLALSYAGQLTTLTGFYA